MELVLPSSPVWYQTKASDTSCDGYFAFASRSLIYLLDIKKDVPSYFGVLNGHEERVTTCSFCIKKPSSQHLLLASGDDDGIIKIWNVLMKAVVNEIKISGVGTITALHWSCFSESVIVFGDDKGCLVVWNYEKATSNKYYPDGPHQQITCVVCSPHYQQLVAVGYKSGAISVVDIFNRGLVIRKFRGHGNEIHSIVWSYYLSEDILSSLKNEAKSDCDGKLPTSPNTQFEGILVSGCKDRTIRIWSLMRGKAVKILKLKAKLSKGKRGADDNARVYIALYWPDESNSIFYSSSYNGDLLQWDLSKPDKEMHEVFSTDAPDSGHQRVVFNINPGLNRKSSVITTSMDRQIKMWSTTSPHQPPVCSVPTLGGFVYSIAISPIDPSMLALGVGDGAIRIWKTQNRRNPFDITVLWQGVKEKVMSLAWNPTKEGVLAFGTEDGKVGLYDVLSLKPPTLSETYHLKPVYAISWGPRCSRIDDDDDVAGADWLYTCGGEGVVLMHPPDLKGDGVDVHPLISATNPDHHPGRRSEVSWRRDGKILAIGNDNGTFDIYQAPRLLHLVSVKVHSKIINCLRWKPDDVSGSKYWIASGSNNSNVCVTSIERNLCESSGAPSCGEDKPKLITEPCRSLIGHSSRITSLAWSRNSEWQLASSSYDGTVQVWDVQESVGIANYRGHGGRVLCVEWSSIPHEDSESGLIYSGGDDYSVHVWKAEKQENKFPPKEPQQGFTQKQTPQWKKKNKKKKISSLTPSHNGADANGVDIERLLDDKRKELLADLQMDVNDRDFTNQDPELSCSSQINPTILNPNAQPFPAPSSGEVKDVLLGLSENRTIAMEAREDGSCRGSRRKRIKSLFPITIALDNKKKEVQQRDCIDVVRYKLDHSSIAVSNLPNLGLYGDRRSAYRMIHREDEKLAESENYDGSYMLKLWTADVIGAVESAIERDDLTDQLVAMAPMAGYDVWYRACTSFADQLARDGLYLHAANYLVACNKVAEAIILLRENKFYREAVAMARARLHDNDPLLVETVKVWAYRLKNGGSYEMAAKCFASVEEYRLAADCLCEKARSKSSLEVEDLRSLFAATVLARIAALEDWHCYVKLALLDVATCSGRWGHAHVAARSFDLDLRFVSLILCVHELLCMCVSSSLNRETFLLDEFPDHVPSKWTNQLTVSASNFNNLLLSTWKCSLNKPTEYQDDGSLELIELKDIECLRSTQSYNGLTLKQCLYKATIHISCLFLLHHESRHNTSQSSIDEHVTSLLAIDDVSLRHIFDDVRRSFNDQQSSIKIHETKPKVDGSNCESDERSEVYSNMNGHGTSGELIDASVHDNGM